MPTQPAVIAPLLLVGVLVVSAIAKRRQPASTRSAIVLLRLPRVLQADWVARALPIGEGVLALLMLAPFLWVARLASGMALLLFVTYLVIIGRAMTFDPRPNCGCFGNIGDQRVRAKTVWRNAFFVGLALVFLWLTATGHTVPSVLRGFDGAQWAWLAGGLAVGAAVALIGPGATGTPAPTPVVQAVDHSAHQLPHAPAEGMEADEEEYVRGPIPHAMLVDPEDRPHLLTTMAGARAQLLVFVNCYCGPTHTVAAAIPPLRERVPQIDVRLVFSSVEVMPDSPTAPTHDAWRDFAGITWSTLGLASSPSAVLLGADGLLAGGPVNGLAEVQDFFEEIVEALSEAPLPEEAQSPGAAAGEPLVGHVVSSEGTSPN